VQLPDDTYQKVRTVADSIPAQLFDETDHVFGCPDCADGGGFYLEIGDAGDKFWLMDTGKSRIPVYLHSFVDLLHAAVDTLQ